MITNNGLNILRDMISGTNPSLEYIAIGTSSAVAIATDTALGTEVNRGSAINFRKYNTGILNDVGAFTKRVEFPATNRNDFREVGIVTASSGGTLFNRIVNASSTTHAANKRIRIDIDLQIRRP